MPFTRRGPWPYAFQNQFSAQQFPPYGFGPMTYPSSGPSHPAAFPYPLPPGGPAFTWPIAPMPDVESAVGFPPQSYPPKNGSNTMSPLMAFLSGGEDQDYEENPEAIPALYDPDEDEMPSNAYEACKDRCYQANRRDIRDCYKKRGQLAKALCIAQANARYGSCVGQCSKYRK
jgi:hypothetical protein